MHGQTDIKKRTVFYLTSVASQFLLAGFTHVTSTSVRHVFVRCGACLRAEREHFHYTFKAQCLPNVPPVLTFQNSTSPPTQCIHVFCTAVREQRLFLYTALTAWFEMKCLTLILRRSRTGTVWFYTSTSNKRTARPKLYTESLTRDLKRMYSCFTLVRISINL